MALSSPCSSVSVSVSLLFSSLLFSSLLFSSLLFSSLLFSSLLFSSLLTHLTWLIQVIDRRIRELQVRSELRELSTPADELKQFKAIIISGGPQSVYASDAPKYDPAIFKLGIPIFGICYGMQLICHEFKGVISRHETREDGQFHINIDRSAPIFKGIDSDQVEVLLTHGDSVTGIPADFKQIAKSTGGLISGVQHKELPIIGVQFHPEVDLTQHGSQMFHNFVFEVAKCTPGFTLLSRKAVAIEYIHKAVGDDNVLVLVSGGVDSSVCAALLHEALPAERIFCLHIDSGFMRKDESKHVLKALQDTGLEVTVASVADRFLQGTTMIDGKQTEPLCECINPETKRKIIGDMFMHISDEYVKKFDFHGRGVYLCQGTLRPDLIESASHIASASATVIKTHHNDTQMVRDLRDKGRIVEPLTEYHKDEVRALGEELGLPEALVWRQPFPGPGLAIRIICATEPYITDDDEKMVTSLQAFATDDIQVTLCPCRSVGVQGDHRSYAHVVALSSSGPPEWAKLFALAKQIPKRVHGVNRVVYVFGDRVQESRYTTVTCTSMSKECIKQLQDADDIVNSLIVKYKLMRKLSQVPVILFPVAFGQDGKRSICIRTFITNDFMTGIPALPGRDMPMEALTEMVESILAQVDGIARVCFDLTSKPPGTTEWE
jgi:GMP synthase (glutamine-hydrolysing)